jgi:hypothetical protein
MKANLCMVFLVFIMTVLLLEIKLSQGIGLGSYQHRHISAPVRPNQDIQRHILWFYMA